MPFSQTWFDMNIDNWTRLLADLKGKPINALEVGCFEGRATCWLLENILTHSAARITCVDTFEGGREHSDIAPIDFKHICGIFKENTRKYDRKIKLLVDRSENALRSMWGEKFELIYIDGSHEAADVLSDAVLAFPLLKKGGIMIFDDYAWDAYPDFPERNPRLAIDSFLGCYKGRYEIILKEYQVAIRKV